MLNHTQGKCAKYFSLIRHVCSFVSFCFTKQLFWTLVSYIPESWMGMSANKVRVAVQNSWNNGKSGAKLDFTSSTKPGLQIHKFDHTRTANLCDWLPCRCAALPLVGCLSATSPSCWGTHFLYLSNPPSGNLLPIISWSAPCTGDRLIYCWNETYPARTFIGDWASQQLHDQVQFINVQTARDPCWKYFWLCCECMSLTSHYIWMQIVVNGDSLR